jgi:hypothetical protein
MNIGMSPFVLPARQAGKGEGMNIGMSPFVFVFLFYDTLPFIVAEDGSDVRFLPTGQPARMPAGI